MNWPFVTRARFEDLRQQLANSEAERKELFERLLDVAAERQQDTGVPATQTIASTPTAGSGAFTTPFDRIEQRCSTALQSGKIPLQFKARAR